MHQSCQPPPKYGLGTARKSRGKNHCHVVRGSLLKARWRWWGRPRVGGGRRWDPYRNAGSAGTRLGLHEVALLRRDCRSSRGGIARATSIRRRHSRVEPGRAQRSRRGISARRDMDDVNKDADTASVRPPTPAPVFRRRPKPKRGRGRPRLPKPPPRHPRPDPSKTSPQASRQQNALFKGLARQMTGLRARAPPTPRSSSGGARPSRRTTRLGDRGGSRKGPPRRSESNNRNRKLKPNAPTRVGRRRGRSRRRKCGVCGGEGHNARTCALAPPRRDSEDLVSYYEAKYGNLGIGIGIPGSSASLISVARNEKNAKRKKKNPVGRPRASLSIAVRCSVCGALGHNRRFHEEKRDFNKSRPGPQAPCTCSWCGREGHNSRVPRAGRRRRLRGFFGLRARLRPRVRDRVRGREGHGRLGFRVSRGAFARSERR